jgi:DNA-binding response OmpR family regulator
MPPLPVLLIVEDDSTLRELYRLALSLSDFTVHACDDGLQALHCLDHEQPDLVVLDLDLPRVAGTMVYEELRARRQTGSVPPVVVVTGLYNVPYLPGATVLRKPVSAESLHRTIVAVLDRRSREWLFVSGPASIRLIRTEEGGESVRLVLNGPGRATAIHREPDTQSGLRRQLAIEQDLIAQGYRLLPFDRRSGHDRRTTLRGTSDRRRPAEAAPPHASV